MLINEYVSMVEPAVQEFGDTTISIEVLKRVKIILEKYHNARKTVNGDAVGILASQSIGEASTQLSLNSFHSVGCTNSTLSLAVPRLSKKRSLLTFYIKIFSSQKSI